MSNKLEEIELRSDEVQEILTHVPHWMIRWGSILFFLLFILIIAISWFIKYPDIIESEAIITTQVPPQNEFAMISAKIENIYVNDSQIVEENTVLAVLENTANAEHVFFLKSILEKIRIENSIIEFPIDSIPILLLGEIDQSFAAFENSYIQYELNHQFQPFSNEVLANSISLSELKLRLASLESQLVLNKSQFSFKMNDLNRSKSLYDKGVISQKEYEDKQLEILSAEKDLKGMAVSISQIREAIGGARNNSKGTVINQTREEKKLYRATIQSYNQLKRAIKNWENTFVLESQINGKVSFLNYWSKNQTVTQGDLIFTIIPSINSNYIAKIKAPPLNSGKIEVGQDVNVKLQNYPEIEFGMIRGKVENISLTPDKDGFYLVNVSLPEKLITSYNKEIEFKQEMRGSAEIVTEDLRLLERFFYQFKELFDR